MPYSKIINIQSKLVNINYEFKFDKNIYFRFLTNENLKGIELTDVTKADDSELNWYQYKDDMKFDDLKSYRILIIQIKSNSIKNNYFEIENPNYYIISKNDWYECKNFGPDCGIEVNNFTLDENKPVQEIDTLFNYIIDGDATITKGKYLKAGSKLSKIILKGKKRNIVNYHFLFNLQPTNFKKPSTSQPKSIKSALDLIDSKVFPYSVSDNKEINSINSRLELIKFQIKNYFVENNKEIDSINECLNTEKASNAIQEIRITDIDSRIEFLKTEVNNLSTSLNTQIETINSNFESVGTNLSKINTLEEDLETLQTNVETNNNSISTINSSITDIDSKLETLENEDIIINTSLSNLSTDITANKNTSENLRSDLDLLKTDFETLDNDYYNFKANSKNLIWDNIGNQPYSIDRHDEVVNINFVTTTNKYSPQKMYLMKDRDNKIQPYYSETVKQTNNEYSAVRLIPLLDI